MSAQARYRWSGDRLTVEDLDRFAENLLQHADISQAKFTHAMTASIIIHFLGKKWYLDHAYLNSPDKSYLKPKFGEDGLAGKYSLITLNLAEMLFNLQSAEGFSTCLEHMNIDQLESALTELQVGMLLYQEKIPFRYVDAKTKDGKSYDIEIIPMPGLTANVEIKCKTETTPCSINTVKNTLKDGLKQLPKDQPGIVFVKVPQHWTEFIGGQVRLQDEVLTAAQEFLQGVTRIVRVIFYLFNLNETAEGIAVTHGVREVKNPNNPPNSPWNDMFFKFDNDGSHWVDMPTLISRWSASIIRLPVD